MYPPASQVHGRVFPARTHAACPAAAGARPQHPQPLQRWQPLTVQRLLHAAPRELHREALSILRALREQRGRYRF